MGGCLRMPDDRDPPEFMERVCDSPSVRTTCTWIRTHALLFGTFVGIAFGFVVGALLNPHQLGDTALVIIGFPGELFLRVLRMLVLPLIISSIITGTTSLDPKTNSRVAMFTISYFLLTSLGSATIGVFLANIFHPGNPDIKSKFVSEEDADQHVRLLDTFFDLFRNALPPNIMEAFLKQFYTGYVWTKKRFEFTEDLLIRRNMSTTMMPSMTSDVSMFYDIASTTSIGLTVPTTDVIENIIENVIGKRVSEYGTTVLPTAVEEKVVELVRTRVIHTRKQMNGLGIIVFLMIFGMILSNMQAKAVILVEYFRVLDKIIMRLIKLVIWFTPIGVASLIGERLASISNLSHTIENLGMYIVTVLVGLFIHQFLLLPAIYYIILRRNPYPFWWNTIQAVLTAFATESSAAALPVAIQCMEDNNKADSRVARFVMPVGSTINMNGTAMFVTIATIFIAQMNNVVPTTAELVTIVLTATAASVASSATPSASLYLMIMTLSVLPNVPLADVALLFTIDWFLDRCRTTNNIVGDCFAVAVVERYYGKELDEHRSELDQIRKDHTVPGLGLMIDD